MRIINFPRALLVVAALVSGDAFAVSESLPMKVDHRVHIVMYQPDQVYRFTGHYRYQSAIEFAPGEEIKTISMGDSTAWMLNPSANRLFLKPLEQDATTNMTVITSEHTYLFELHARETDDIQDKDMVFVMRFNYPDSDSSQTVSKYLENVPVPGIDDDVHKYNFSYTISGSEEVAPIRIFDDGEFTYFQFRDKNAEVPAFYTVDRQGNEAIINYRTRGDYIVVERVSSRMTLRHGIDIVCIFNEAWNPNKVTSPPAN
jgi:type IV secretion system protein VirB9